MWFSIIFPLVSPVLLNTAGLRGNSTSCGNVAVQGPEICFPKHAPCDFTQHCRAQHQACCFLEISCEEKDETQTPFPLILRCLECLFFAPPFRLFFYRIMWTFKALGVWHKILGCWTCAARFVPLFLLKCQHGECVGQSGQACWSAFRKSTSCLSGFYFPWSDFRRM